MFLNEGIKIYFRMIYSLCKILKTKILNIRDTSTMKNTIRNAALEMNN
jgi:hypothetical protein